MGTLNIVLGAIDNGLIWGFLALGVYITFRILKISDLTVDGSFATGGAVCAMLVASKGQGPLVAILCAIIAGGLAGAITGLLHTKLQIPAILAGILTQLSLYSINLRIMDGRANVALASYKDSLLFKPIADALGITKYYSTLMIAGAITIAVIALLYCFFKTELGSAINATGDSEQMARSLGIDTDIMKIIGLIIANALVGLSGALYTLYGAAADVRMGTGAIVIALASIVIGEVIVRVKKGGLGIRLASAVIGSIIYRIIVSIVLQLGFNTDDLKLLTAVLVAVALATPILLAKRNQKASYKKLTAELDAKEDQ